MEGIQGSGDSPQTLDAALGEALEDAFPGLRVLDRELEIGGGRVAQLVCADGRGRLTLVLWAERDDDEIALAALDALAYARQHVEVLASHFPSARLDPRKPPHVALIGERFGRTALARLAGLDPASMRCLEVHAVATRETSRLYLVGVLPAPESTAPATRRDPGSFLDGLDAGLRSVGELVVRRMERLDDEVRPWVADEGLTWRLGREELCTLYPVPGAIEARVPPGDRTSALATPADVDDFLESVMRRYVGVLDRAEPAPIERRKDRRARPPGEPAAEAFDPTAELLSPEELEAFRDPS